MKWLAKIHREFSVDGDDYNNNNNNNNNNDRLCGLVVRVLGNRSRDPGSIPDTTRFSEK
jgi:hypothetical protein